MRPTLTCPKCHVRLHLPEPMPDGPMVCPRCDIEVKDAPPAPVLDLSAPLSRPIASASTRQEPVGVPPDRLRDLDNLFLDPNKRGFVLFLALCGAAAPALLWYVVRKLNFRDEDALHRFALEAGAVGAGGVAFVLAAYRQLWGKRSPQRRARGQAALVLTLFTVVGVLVLLLAAGLILCISLCMVIDGPP